jgi:hypothetical protein
MVLENPRVFNRLLQILFWNVFSYQIFREIGYLERGPLSLVRTMRSYLKEKLAAPV